MFYVFDFNSTRPTIRSFINYFNSALFNPSSSADVWMFCILLIALIPVCNTSFFFLSIVFVCTRPSSSIVFVFVCAVLCFEWGAGVTCVRCVCCDGECLRCWVVGVGGYVSWVVGLVWLFCVDNHLLSKSRLYLQVPSLSQYSHRVMFAQSSFTTHAVHAFMNLFPIRQSISYRHFSYIAVLDDIVTTCIIFVFIFSYHAYSPHSSNFSYLTVRFSIL